MKAAAPFLIGGGLAATSMPRVPSKSVAGAAPAVSARSGEFRGRHGERAIAPQIGALPQMTAF